MPTYGALNWMISYTLGRDGMPRFKALNRNAGNIGSVRISADGKRAAYLSSGDISAWNPQKLDDAPVTYRSEGPRQATDLAFHPALPLVACLGADGPLIFNRESGEPDADRLDAVAADLRDSKLHRLWFSADGNHLIVDTSVNDIHYLYQAKLKLKAGEAATIESYLAASAADSEAQSAASPAVPLVGLAQFDALKGGLGREMTAKEIAQWFTDSVVVVGTGDGSGSGFVVGSTGYILTSRPLRGRRRRRDGHLPPQDRGEARKQDRGRAGPPCRSAG